jgi:hypothetical protein
MHAWACYVAQQSAVRPLALHPCVSETGSQMVDVPHACPMMNYYVLSV